MSILHTLSLRALLISTIFTALVSIEVRGQGGLSYMEGTKYIVAFMKVWASSTEKPLPKPVQILIYSRDTCTVHVESIGGDAVKINNDYTVLPGKVLRVAVPYPGYAAPEHGDVTGGGIFVSSTKPISVSSTMQWDGNGEVVRHYPMDSWGTDYRTFNLYQDRYGTSAPYKNRPAQALLISGFDETVVEIRTKYPLQYGGPNIDSIGPLTYRVKMNAYERVLLLWNINENLNRDWLTDPTGTRITSNKPIGVLSGHTKGAIMRMPDVLPPTGMFAAEAHFVRNCLQEALLPSYTAGTDFVTVPIMYPLRTRGQDLVKYGMDDDRGDVIRFIATEDNTNLWRKRQDLATFARVATLNAGEVYSEYAQESATVWNADKPVMAMQYGKSWAKVLPPKEIKDENAPQGHPTVESGMPMMQVVPPVDRWITGGAFTSDYGTDNYVNIVCDSGDVDEIRLDGEILATKYGNEMKSITESKYRYFSITLKDGDHTITSDNANVRFMAWSYGSLDGLQQGRAYGSVVGVDLYVPCEDTITSSTSKPLATGECGVYVTDVEVLSGGKNCSRLHSIVLGDAINMVIEQNTVTETTQATYTIRTLDVTKDASAVVRVMTTSGNYRDLSYRYDAATFSVTPNKIEFGNVPIKEQRCSTVTIRNTSASDTLIINNIAPAVYKPVFSMMPSQAILAPGDTMDVLVCATPENSILIVDTAIVHTSCYTSAGIELKVKGGVPQIEVGDASWQATALNQWFPLSFSITNPGDVDLTITNIAWNADTTDDEHFQMTSPMPTFPFVIAPSSQRTFDIAFNPHTIAGEEFRKEVVISSNATSGDSILVLQGSTLGVSSVDEEHRRSVIVHPQPVRLSAGGTLNVSSQDEVLYVSITNQIGQVIGVFPTNGTASVPTSAFPSPGMYVLVLETSSGVIRTPVICIE